MDDDQRRRLLQKGVNLTQPGPTAGQIPLVIYRLNALSGQLEATATTGEGVNFFSDRNAQPPPRSRLESGALDFASGGGSVEFVRLPPPIDRQGAGVDFIALDPVPEKVPGSDIADKRPLRNGGAVVFG